ncbi:MAG: radical SAM protein [Brevinematia bacterium]
MYRTIYGPVPSRRLGISLGIDIIPYKVCSFNCIYCECGKNTELTIERKDFLPIEIVLEEIEDYLSRNPPPDFITISGSGEPTLHLRLGLLLEELKNRYPLIKLAVLTNSSLLYIPEVRKDLYPVDLVLPSLDAATEKAFKHINRPFHSLKLEKIIEGIALLNKELKSISNEKKMWLEVFIVEGINTDEKSISSLREACILINPDKIQLNTLDRPGTESWVKPASKETLEMVKERLDLPNIEIISKFKHRDEIRHYRKDIESTILEIVERRPAKIEDISEVLGISEKEISKYIDVLLHENRIVPKIVHKNGNNDIFYCLNRKI